MKKYTVKMVKKKMSKDQVLGALLLIGAIAVIGVYGWMIYAGYSWYAFLIVASIAVVGVMFVVAWIGYTMATTPPPEPIEFEKSTETKEEPPATKETK